MSKCTINSKLIFYHTFHCKPFFLQHTREQWGIILNSAAAFLVLEAIVYTVFGSGQEQPWNKPNVANDSKDVEHKDAVEDKDEETNM